MKRPWQISRRTFLRGALGTAVALPFLEAMEPSPSRAATSTPPRRAIFLFIPVGFRHEDAYTPSTTPTGSIPYTLPTVLAPLADLQSKVTLVGNLANHPCEGGNGDSHERGTSSLFTCQPAMLNGSTVTNGISIDQLAAANITGVTIPSLELGVEAGTDSGKGVLYTNVSWKDATTPVAKEIDPGRLWDRLFTDLTLSPSELALRRARKTSVLHYVNDSANALRKKLGKLDQQKLDQYLTGIQALETRLQAANQCAIPVPGSPVGTYDNSGGTDVADVTGVTAHHDLMLDLVVHAFACDLTRVASFMFVQGGFSGWDFLGFSDEHHYMSHFPDDPSNATKLDQICTWEMQRLAKLLKGLDSITESDGTTALDNTLVFLSSDVADGSKHNYDNLPVILAGGGNKVTKMGQYINPSTEQPLANLYISMLEFLGIQQKTFGANGTGPLADLMV